MSFTIADGVVAAIVLISGLLAYSRGLVRESLAILGWIAAAVGALAAAPYLEPLLREIPKVGPILASACTLSKFAAFAIAFALVLLLLSIFTPLLSGAVQENRVLGPIDRALGFVFGALRGLVLVAVVYLVYVQVVPPADRIDEIDKARSVVMIDEAATALEEALPDDVPEWAFEPINDLMAECGGIPALSQETDAAEAPAPTTAPATAGEAVGATGAATSAAPAPTQ